MTKEDKSYPSIAFVRRKTFSLEGEVRGSRSSILPSCLLCSLAACLLQKMAVTSTIHPFKWESSTKWTPAGNDSRQGHDSPSMKILEALHGDVSNYGVTVTVASSMSLAGSLLEH
jgi:hypothetical protein